MHFPSLAAQIRQDKSFSSWSEQLENRVSMSLHELEALASLLFSPESLEERGIWVLSGSASEIKKRVSGSWVIYNMDLEVDSNLSTHSPSD